MTSVQAESAQSGTFTSMFVVVGVVGAVPDGVVRAVRSSSASERREPGKRRERRERRERRHQQKIENENKTLEWPEIPDFIFSSRVS